MQCYFFFPSFIDFCFFIIDFQEFDVDDVGFVQESLQYLPYAPSLSFLRQVTANNNNNDNNNNNNNNDNNNNNNNKIK